jgi:UDP-GlcNAc3NAcA epimerase
MKKILTVVGARPQFIKAAPVSMALKESKWCCEIVVHTGQHYDKNMSETFFDELNMQPPNFNLGVGSGTHANQTGEIMKHLEPILVGERPELIIVYGDTNSTLAAALTASKLYIPVAHIESGLRSFNREMPEEINRVVTDHIATLLFCPTTTAVQNLEKEGITNNVFNAGDVMFDVAVQYSQRAEEKSRILFDLKLEKREYILATVHRAENTDDKKRLSNILAAFKAIDLEMPIVFPLHPRTRKMLHNFGLEDQLNGLVVIEPVGFLDMLFLEKNARLIVTDSGGVQKEAYFHQVPCVTLRNETEWVETLESNWNVLANVDTVDGIAGPIRASITFSNMRSRIHEYGDGRASYKIVHALERYLAKTGERQLEVSSKSEMINKL